MIQFVIGAGAGYLLGTKAGRRRYEQIRKGYEVAVNSDITKAVVRGTRKAIANKIDPEPRMQELRNLNPTTQQQLGEGQSIVEVNDTHPLDRAPRNRNYNPFKK